MSEDNKAAAEAVETTEEGVSNSDIATSTEETVTMSKAQVDELISAAETATALAAKKTSDAENYQKGMMKYKTLLKDNGIEDEEENRGTSKEEIAQMIRDAIKETIPQVVNTQQDDELIKANQKIEEMKIAFANGAKKVASAAGSNAEKDNVTGKTAAEKYFSSEQKAEILRKFPNADFEAIYKNLPKGNDMKGSQ